MATEIIIRDEELRQNAIDVLASLDLSRPYVMEVKHYVKKRTLSQNALYHKIKDILANEFGYEVDEMHEELKRIFLPASGRKIKVGLDGVEREYLTTKTLNTSEFKDYLDAIYRFGSKNGIFLPHPDDLLSHNFSQ